MVTYYFLKPLQDLLHAVSLDERRCTVCHIPYSPADSGILPAIPNSPDMALCPSCRTALRRRDYGYCSLCGDGTGASQTEPVLCGECLASPPPWEHFRCYGMYSGALKSLLLRGKFGADPGILRLLGHLLASICADLPRPDVVIPVPLHTSRLRERGFNQSLELAKPLATAFGVPLEPNWLQRHIPTRHQVGLTGAERRSNLKSAFVASPAVRGKRILLVDDTYTTGTTLKRATLALLARENAYDPCFAASAVDVVVVARSIRRRELTAVSEHVLATKERMVPETSIPK